jgi:hypothetical protein
MTESALGTLTWPERIENYRRLIEVPHLGHENGWTYGTWFIGNSYQKKTGYYGAYQGNFLKRIAALFPDRRVRHLFAGRVDLTRFPGDTLDIRPELEPTYCVNAETCEGVPLADYDFVLADPPYSASDGALRHDHGEPEQGGGYARRRSAVGRLCGVAGSGLSDVQQGGAEARGGIGIVGTGRRALQVTVCRKTG